MGSVLDKGLETLGNKARNGLKEAISNSQQNEEKTKRSHRGVTYGIHLAQEDHCSQLSFICCWRLAMF
jgi:hypothetical protein